MAKTKMYSIMGDITRIDTEAIVDPAKTLLLGGSGIDEAIHRVAGKGLRIECAGIPVDVNGNRCPVGEARITKGHGLKAKWVIHTVGPLFSPECEGDCEYLLRSCYINCLVVAMTNGIKTISFPGISTGINGYPAVSAAQVAVNAVVDFVIKYPQKLAEVIFVTADKNVYQIYEDILAEY